MRFLSVASYTGEEMSTSLRKLRNTTLLLFISLIAGCYIEFVRGGSHSDAVLERLAQPIDLHVFVLGQVCLKTADDAARETAESFRRMGMPAPHFNPAAYGDGCATWSARDYWPLGLLNRSMAKGFGHHITGAFLSRLNGELSRAFPTTGRIRYRVFSEAESASSFADKKPQATAAVRIAFAQEEENSWSTALSYWTLGIIPGFDSRPVSQGSVTYFDSSGEGREKTLKEGNAFLQQINWLPFIIWGPMATNTAEDRAALNNVNQLIAEGVR